jgi:hypothetical protein
VKAMIFLAGLLTGIVAAYLLIGYSLSLASPIWMDDVFDVRPIWTIAHLFNFLGGA